MTHTTVSTANPMTATLAMSDRLGTSFIPNGEKGLKAEGISIADIETKGEIYRGRITGILPAADIQGATVGFYEGQTQLTVTLNGTAGASIQ